jgi:RimJ/RimL family protein N-acetyltransferase
MLIRKIKPEDAESFVYLIKQVEAEAEYMLMEAGERNISPEQQRKRLEQMEKESNSTILVAEQEDGKLLGYLISTGGNAKRTKHCAYLVIGILNQYQGLGIGTQLFKHLEEWAREHNIHRLELSVVTRNEAGLRLYKKIGFEIEGTKRHSLYIDGEFVDEYYMSKLL